MDSGQDIPLTRGSRFASPIFRSTVEAPEGTPESQCPRLLTAEDNDDLRLVMKAILELHGFQVTACVDAEEAESTYLQQHPFDLLVTDIQMPGKSGVELASNLCRINPALPVLIVSGTQIDAQQLQEFSSKGWSYISKPYAIPELISQIKTLLASRSHKDGSASHQPAA